MNERLQHRLPKNSIGLFHIVFFVVAAAAPLTAVVGATPAAFAFGNGAGVAGAFLLAGALYLLFSVGFTAMSRFVGGTGAFYTYISQGLGKPLGVAGGLISLVAYNAVQIGIYALLGLFTHDALAPLRLPCPWYAYSILAILLATLLGRRNVAFSGAVLGVCMVAEVLILLLLDLAIVRHGGSHGLDLQPFSPAAVASPGLGVSLVFALGSYIGFEATAIFAEETRNPEKVIPLATYVAVLLITGFYAFSTWAITEYYGADHIAVIAQVNIDNLYFDPAARLLGLWASQAMKALLISSLFACVLSFHNTISRYLFSFGREGLAWRGLGQVHPRHGSPANAGLAQSLLAFCIVAAFAIGGQSPYAVVFSWMSALAVIGIVTVQILVSLSVVAFFRVGGRGVGIWSRLLAPLASVVGLSIGLGLVIKNLPLLSGSHSPVVTAFPYVIGAVGAAGVVNALWLRWRRPMIYRSLGRVFES